MSRRKPARESRLRKGNARRVKIERLESRCLLTADAFFPHFEMDDLRDAFDNRREQPDEGHRHPYSESNELRRLDREFEREFDRDDSYRRDENDHHRNGRWQGASEDINSRRGSHEFRSSRREHQNDESDRSQFSFDSGDMNEHEVFDNDLYEHEYFEEDSLDTHAVDVIFSAESIDFEPVIEFPRSSPLTIVFVSIPRSRVLSSPASQSDSIPDPVSPRSTATQQPARTTGTSAPDLDEIESSPEDASPVDLPTSGTEIQTPKPEATTLVSATTNVARFDSSIVDIGTAEPSWPSANYPFVGGTVGANEIDDTEIGRWLHRAYGVHDKFSELDGLLAELSTERRVKANSNHHANTPVLRDGSRQQPEQSRWLNATEGLILLMPGQQATRAASKISPEAFENMDQVASAGWTVGIGFFRAFEAASDDSFAPAIVAAGQPIATAAGSSGDASNAGTNDWRDGHDSSAFATSSANRAFGFMVGCAGIYLLRNRKHRDEGDESVRDGQSN